MARLPNYLLDKGEWGNVLNEFELVSHNTDGTLRSTALAAAGVDPADMTALKAFQGRAEPTDPAELGKIVTIGADGIIRTRTPYVDACHPRFGASPAATWEVNRDAFNNAINEVNTAGGGKVIASTPGTYTVKGIVQKARVDIDGVNLKAPDATLPDVIKSYSSGTNGTIATGSTALTVTSAVGIEVGCLVGIAIAGGSSPTQWSTLTTAIDAIQTTGITLASGTGFNKPAFVVVDNEVIGYTDITAGGELTGVTRGMYGTTAATHAAGARAGYALRHVAEVLAVSGTTVTLSSPAPFGVTTANVVIGIVYPSLTNVTIDGSRVNGVSAAAVRPLNWHMVRFGRISNYRVKRASAAFMFNVTSDCIVDGVHAHDCSEPEQSLGSVFWLFQRCNRNVLKNFHVTGDMWAGVILDDRTTLANQWDGPCNDNQGGNWTFNVLKHDPFITNTALLINCGNRNRFSTITSRNVWRGFTILPEEQTHTGDGSIPGATGNHIDQFTMIAGSNPYYMSATGNLVTGLKYDALGNGTNTGNNIIMYSAVTPNGDFVPVRFGDGTVAAPSITFASDTGTGFYKIAAGQMAFVSGGSLIFRFRTTSVLLEDGKNLEIGTVNGSRIGLSSASKLGFWGATPVVRPTALTARNASVVDAVYGAEETAVIENLRTRLNELEDKLKAIGLLS